jgi:hypothetical protein
VEKNQLPLRNLKNWPYIGFMNRRRFLQSVAAVFTLPALPALSFGSSAAVPSAAVAVPTQARFWAIYMSGLHGECPPHALQTLLNIPASEANTYVTQLVAEGVIKPNPLLQRSVSRLIKSDDDSLLGKVKKRLQMKSEAQQPEQESVEPAGDVEWLEAEHEVLAEEEGDTPDLDEIEVGEENQLETDQLDYEKVELDETGTQNGVLSERI